MKKLAIGLLSLVLCSCSSTNLLTPKTETLVSKTVQREAVEETNSYERIVKDYLEKKVDLLRKQVTYLEMGYSQGIIGYELGFVETKMNLAYFETALKAAGEETNLYDKVYRELERWHWIFPTEDKEMRKWQIDRMIEGVKVFEGAARRKYEAGLSNPIDLLRAQNYLLDFAFMSTKYEQE